MGTVGTYKYAETPGINLETNLTSAERRSCTQIGRKAELYDRSIGRAGIFAKIGPLDETVKVVA